MRDYGTVIQTVLNADLIRNRVGNPAMRSRPNYIDLVTAFDIETTRLEDIEHSIMYVWQWQFGLDCLIMGRTWEEFLDLIRQLSQYIKAAFGQRARLVVWVHNLSYEFQFLRGIYPFRSDEVFVMERRKIAKCSLLDSFEFRCSYIHSNMSLDLFTRKMGCTVRKLTGTFDYSKIRYPWTPLTPDELAYCVHDVQALVEAITREMQMDGDNLSTIPMTSTGYVRRDAKNVLVPPVDHTKMDPEEIAAAKAQKSKYNLWLSDQLVDYPVYCALREAFRGGNTHANRFYSKRILENVHSVDRSSSYPDVLVNCQFPISDFSYRGEISLERLEINTAIHKKAALFRIQFDGLELRDPWTGCPYLTKDKSRHLVNGLYDNGRILSADHLETTLTDIDYWIVKSQYTWTTARITQSWFARYGYLPDEFRQLINHYYTLKTELKGDETQKVFYEKIKAKINALYGMCAQNPVKENLLFAPPDVVAAFYMKHPEYMQPPPGSNYIPDDSKTPEELLDKYNRRAFLVYQWGVWVTAHARRELQEMIDLAGDNFVYTDTDSVKYLGDLDLQEYNDRIRARSISNGAYATDAKGRQHYMGIYEVEQDYNRFVTLGAKKYAYDVWDKYPVGDVTLQLLHTHVTCAGVNKELGAEELARAGGVEAFKDGMVFREAGGTESLYNDNVDFCIQREGHDLHITDNVVIRPIEYTLGLTEEYKMLLHRAELMRQLGREIRMDEMLTNLLDNGTI